MYEDEQEVVEMGCVYSHSKEHRLRLFFVRWLERNGGLNFHSIVWEQSSLDGWDTIVTITPEDFQKDHKFTRWICDLYSIDPQRGWAVIKIGEGDKPYATNRAFTFLYSWRTWDLRNNREIGMLKPCAFPLEPFD